MASFVVWWPYNEHTIPSAHIVVFTSVMSEVLRLRADLCALAEPMCNGKCPSITILWVRFFAIFLQIF